MIQTPVCRACRHVLRTVNISPLLQQTRNTVIIRRRYPPALHDVGWQPALKRKEFIYEVVEETRDKPLPDLRVILRQDVEGIGFKNDVIMVPRSLARNRLLICGAAVYASPENLEALERDTRDTADVQRQSITAQKTIRKLGSMCLRVPMNPDRKWTLNRGHIRIAFRKTGVQLKEDCITMPDEQVKDFGEIQVTVMVNGIERVTVDAIVYAYEKDPVIPPTFPPVMKKTAIPLGTVMSNY